MLYSLQIILATPFVFVFLYLLFNYLVKGDNAVCVVVLGDIGRSPRIQYHAASFAREGFNVDIVGYAGSTPHKQMQHEKITLHHMLDPPVFFKVLPRLLNYMVKVVWQSISLGCILLLVPKAKYIFLQNPPAIPTLAVAWVVCLIRSSFLVIDWHNYGYTILGLSLGPRHPLVKFSNWYEKFFGRFAYINFCVTNAMRNDLRTNWNISAITLYDKAPEHFKKTPVDVQHHLYKRLSQEHSIFTDKVPTDSTVFTRKDVHGQITHREDRPALIVSSTSWTEDEDFGILLEALKLYEKNVQTSTIHLPNIICAITGKGPQKDYYEKEIEKLNFKHVSFCLPWLTPEDYPLLLGSADLGVCLHKSSSGLDLPMKVVDMFGCELPVCAVHFDCISELVKHDVNGLIFSNSDELASQLEDLLQGFPSNRSKLKRLRTGVKMFQDVRWHDQWKKLALPLFTMVEKVKKD
ncbi:chitobiosyldiphosphodolichol beta-mannosyltransferase-like [Gigantopelta aegis]|uniref:chitobiosyldiphosphodolichol beta-mannosyltransferase-like n=1 Tax=Gigantopelta aegis TaxID=1735272 RepID=UPI001B88871F|nr:chitobiosyldiphosphodolichol beta-mannosyltransferase-like [Gigantopelta aegis]